MNYPRLSLSIHSLKYLSAIIQLSTSRFFALCKPLPIFLALITPQNLYADLLSDFKEIRDADRCNPLRHDYCAMPYPSNFYAYDDPSSATGKRLYAPDDFIDDKTYAKYGENLRPSRVMQELTGYSALTAILFEIPRKYDKSTLPITGGETLKIYNRETGEALDFFVEPMLLANQQDKNSHYIIIQAYPRGRWPYGDRVIAVLTNNLTQNGGEVVQPSPGVVRAIYDPESNYKESLGFIEAQGIEKEEVVSFTEFQVRDYASVANPMQLMMDKVAADEHPIRVTSISYPNSGPAVIVKGEVQLSDFRQEDGSIEYNEASVSEPLWVPFQLFLPEAAQEGPVPLVFYGHPLGVGLVAMESMYSGSEFQKNGIAMIGISFPYHPPRDRGKHLLTMLINPKNYLELTGSVGQSTFDLYSLQLAVERHIQHLNVLPRLSQQQIDAVIAGEGAGWEGPGHLDTERMFYAGYSLGSIFGQSFAALSPGIKGAFVALSGGNIALTLNYLSVHRTIRRIGFEGLAPRKFSPAVTALAFNIATHRIDYADGLNYAQNFKEAPEGMPEKSLTVNYGVGDAIVHNYGAYSLADVAGLPLVLTDEVRQRPQTDDDLIKNGRTVLTSSDNGSGLYRSRRLIPKSWMGNIVTDLLSHGSVGISATYDVATREFVEEAILK